VGPAWQCLGHRASHPNWLLGWCPPVILQLGIKPPCPDSAGPKPPFPSPDKPLPCCHLFPRCRSPRLTSVLLPRTSSPVPEPSQSHHSPSLGSRAPPSEGSSEDHRAAVGEGPAVHLPRRHFYHHLTRVSLLMHSWAKPVTQATEPSSEKSSHREPLEADPVGVYP
jgi:hypothetical protein